MTQQTNRQMIKWGWIGVGCLVVLVAYSLVGCSSWVQQMADPNGKPIQIAHEVNAVLPIGTTTGTMMVGLGVPGGQIVLLATTVIGALLSVLFGWQKKIANGQTSAVTATTKAIVDAIEEVSAVKTADGTTVGEIVKAKVQSNMQANNIYEVGKQIVTALKTAE